MATVRVSMKVCDICRKNEGVQKYAMTLPGQERKWLDLCVEHAAPLEGFRDVRSTAARGSRQLSSPEEIEKLRQPKRRK